MGNSFGEAVDNFILLQVVVVESLPRVAAKGFPGIGHQGDQWIVARGARAGIIIESFGSANGGD